MSLKISQRTLLEHSEVKIELLRLYLIRYLTILNHSEYVEEVYLYDLFCGEGIYDNEGKGSPIIILDVLLEVLENNQNNTRFHCLFNDLDESKIRNLESSIQQIDDKNLDRISIQYSNNDYQDLIPSLSDQFKSLQKQKAFVFIDPYGYKDIHIKDIEELLFSENVEVLLFLPTQFMFRFHEKETPESLKAFISELLPEEKWPKSSTGIAFIENLKIAFRDYFNSSRFVDSFIITRDKGQFFCLFFFTSHILGFEKMLEAKWKLDEEEGRGWTFQPENSLFSELTKLPNISRFKEELESFLKHRARCNAETYYFTIVRGFRTCHAVQMLKDWQTQNRLTSKNSNGTDARKGAFYLNFKDYRKDPTKIFLKLD